MAQEHANRANKRDPRNAVMDVRPGSFEDKAARYPGHIKLVDDDAAGPRAKGWAVLYDGELVFSVDADKWETIGPGVTAIMSDGKQPEPTYTRGRLVTAINAAADLTGELMNPSGYESSESIRSDDAMNMVVNMAGYLLDHPDGTVNDVILENWSQEEEDFENAGVLAEPVDEAGNPRELTEAERQAVDEAQIERIRGWFE